MSDSAVVLNRMTTMIPRKYALSLAVAAWMVCGGCRQPTSTVSGVVTIDGKPMTLASDTRGTIVFQPTGGQGATATGLLDATGHFKLATGSQSDIAPGKYQVAISVIQLLPPTEDSEQAGKRVTPAKYSSAIDSGLQANVVPGENQLKFDLSSAEESAEPADAADEVPTETQRSAEPEQTPEQ